MTDILISFGFAIMIILSSFLTSDRMRKRLQSKARRKAFNQTATAVMQEQQQWSKATEWAMKATNPAYYVIGAILVVSVFMAICRGTHGVLMTHPLMLAANSTMAILLVVRAYHLRRLDIAMAKVERHAEMMEGFAGRNYIRQIHIPEAIRNKI